MKSSRTFCIAGAILLLFLVKLIWAVEGDSLWSQTFGGPFDEDARAVIQALDGGYLLAGETESFGAGDADIWLVKTSEQGDSLWSRTYGRAYWDVAASLIATLDGGYLVAGSTEISALGNRDLWLLKTNGQGDTLWTRHYGGEEWDQALSVIQTADSGYLAVGFTESFGAGYRDVWLLKTDAIGDSLWSRTYGGYSGEWAHCVIASADGGYLLAGDVWSFGSGAGDIWLLKIDDMGDTLWSRTFGTEMIECACSLIQTFDGGYALAGSSGFTGAYDQWLIKTNASGDSLWGRVFGGDSEEFAYSLLQAWDGGYLLAGSSNSIGSGAEDILLVRTDSAGDSLWSRTYGGALADRAISMIKSSTDDYMLTGQTYSYGAGADDMWLVCVDGLGLPVTPEPSTFHPSSFVLHPCHPNPFNPSTVASFELPVASHVGLRVYDTAGKLVATLVDGWRPAGKHQAIFDGADLPSGIYLARLAAGDYSAVQKMVLLK